MNVDEFNVFSTFPAILWSILQVSASVRRDMTQESRQLNQFFNANDDVTPQWVRSLAGQTRVALSGYPQHHLYGLQTDDQSQFEYVETLLEDGWVID